MKPYDVDKTVEIIIANAKVAGWSVPKVHNFQETLVSHNQLDPGRVEVVKVCEKEYAGRLLGDDDTTFASTMMPCSGGVYEKRDGYVYVYDSSMNTGLMAKMFGGAVAETVAKVADDDAKILRFLEE